MVSGTSSFAEIRVKSRDHNKMNPTQQSCAYEPAIGEQKIPTAASIQTANNSANRTRPMITLFRITLLDFITPSILRRGNVLPNVAPIRNGIAPPGRLYKTT